jgi:hypothetical protein
VIPEPYKTVQEAKKESLSNPKKVIEVVEPKTVDA